MCKMFKLLLITVYVGSFSFVPANAQGEYKLPSYSSRDGFVPVVGKNGMVSVRETIAAEIGAEILEKGGNAIDAAAAVGFALAVTLSLIHI